MATKEIGALLISLKGDTKALQSSFKSAMGAIAGVTATVGIATAAIVKIMKTTVEYGEELDKMSKMTGVSTEAISKLGYAAKMEHSSMEALGTGLKFLSRNAVGAAQGSEESSKAFKAMGISVVDVNGKMKPTNDILLEMADFMNKKNIPAAQKTALAMAVLGRSGAELVPLLSLGRQELERLGKEAESVGEVMSSENAKKLEEFGDQVEKLKSRWHGLTVELGIHLLPVLNKVMAAIGFGGKEAELKRLNDELLETGKLYTAVLSPGAKGYEEAMIKMAMQGDTIITLRDKIVSLMQQTTKLKEEQEDLGKATEDTIPPIKKQTSATKEWLRVFKETMAAEELAETRSALIHKRIPERISDTKKLIFVKNDEANTWKRLYEVIDEQRKAYEGVGNQAKITASEILNIGYSVESMYGMMKEGEFTLSGFLKSLSGILMMIPGMQGYGAGAGGLGILAGLFGMRQGGLLVPAQAGIVVNRPTAILAGEGGKAEIVSPIDKFFNLMKSMQPRIEIMSADPNTTVRFYENMPIGVKDKFYRQVIREASKRDTARL